MKFIFKQFIILILSLILIVLGFYIAIQLTYKVEYKVIVEKYSKEFGIEEELIFAIIKNESNFKKNVVSNKDAIGLMQILESTKKDMEEVLGVEGLDLKKDVDNILVVTKYLSILKQKYDSIELAIAAYNAGPRECR